MARRRSSSRVAEGTELREALDADGSTEETERNCSRRRGEIHPTRPSGNGDTCRTPNAKTRQRMAESSERDRSGGGSAGFSHNNAAASAVPAMAHRHESGAIPPYIHTEKPQL